MNGEVALTGVNVVEPGLDPGRGELVTVELGEGVGCHQQAPVGDKPFRTVVDFTGAKVRDVDACVWDEQRDFITRMGLGDLLQLNHR